MTSTLRQVAAILGHGDVASTPWHELHFQHVAALRAKCAETCAPATVNKALAAVREVLKAAWRLGLMATEACMPDFERCIAWAAARDGLEGWASEGV